MTRPPRTVPVALAQLLLKIEQAEPNDPRLQGWAEQIRQVLIRRKDQ